MHVWSHDPLCRADAERTRGEGGISNYIANNNLIRALVRLSSERIRRSPDERLALETFWALRGNFSVDPMLNTTPTQSA